MKKILLMIVAVIAVALGAQARDDYSRDPAVLPEAARTVLKSNFKAKVSVIKIDKDFGRVSDYEVTLTDGTEIKFDSKGNWKEVEVAIDKTVPKAFVPAEAAAYVKANQPKARVIGIEKERNGYEVTLNNGVDIKFDKAGKFVKFD